VERTGFAALENLLASLDPFALKQAIETKLRAVLRHEVRPALRRVA